MSSLITSPLPQLLARLFDEADAAHALLSQQMGDIPDSDVHAMITSTTEYRTIYGQFKDQPLAVSRDTGALLYMLARSTGAKTIVEFGTSFGISTLHLAAALRDNGGGRLIGSEFEASKVQRARQHLEEGGLADLVEIREGDALQTLSVDLPPSIDLILLDGAKGLYPAVLALLEPALRVGGLVIADNADWVPDYLSHVRSSAHGFVSAPLGDELEMSMKVRR